MGGGRRMGEGLLQCFQNRMLVSLLDLQKDHSRDGVILGMEGVGLQDIRARPDFRLAVFFPAKVNV